MQPTLEHQILFFESHFTEVCCSCTMWLTVFF